MLASVLLLISVGMAVVAEDRSRERIVVWAGDKAQAVADSVDAFDATARMMTDRAYRPFRQKFAEKLELDAEAFTACLNDPAALERVRSDMDEGAPFVQGTPTFIVLYNEEGRIIPGALPLETFTQALQEILDQAQ